MEAFSQKKEEADSSLKYPFQDKSITPFDKQNESGLFLKKPSNIKGEFIYDEDKEQYIYQEKIGNYNYRPPTYMTIEEYKEYDMRKAQRAYWKEASDVEMSLNDEGGGFAPKLHIKGDAFNKIFGSNVIDIQPQGSAELSFGVKVNRQDRPNIPEKQRRTTTFDFNEKIQLNVTGKIGDKMKLSTSYNTEATFDFENKMNLGYTGGEDEIIQRIEAGNVSLPLSGSLITGSQTLFGVRSDLKFGRLMVSSVLSQEKGERKEIEVSGGAQIQKFEVNVSDYEANKHFFLAHYFRDNYEKALENLPLVNSNINITKVEIWVKSTQGETQVRPVIGFMDLGEENQAHIYNALISAAGAYPVPDNDANNLYFNVDTGYANSQLIRNFSDSKSILEGEGYRNGTDFERIQTARLLKPSEYTFHPQLGYITLNQTLRPTDAVAVAFQFTYNGKLYQVGDLSQDDNSNNALYLKLIKPTTLTTRIPSWDLMMKNVYSLGAYNVSKNDFILDIWYLNPKTGVEIPYFPTVSGENSDSKRRPIVNDLDLDKADFNNSPFPDGVYDFIEGVTINSSNGRVYFPVLEPFSTANITNALNSNEIGTTFGFDSLYRTTQALAKLDADKNRFSLKGQYQSSSGSEISLNTFNIPKGAVKITAGGQQLVEGQDFTVDYNLGRVQIINEGILQSGTPIKISVESNALFNIQTKTLVGTHLDYKINKNTNVGATILNLTERPLTRKINFGDEPISNTIWGLNGNYSTDAPFITRAMDFLPLINTKEPSSISVTGEFAHLIPGNSKAITKEGTSYIDDFEGSQSRYSQRSSWDWVLASTPQHQPNLFPEANGSDETLLYGYNRAKLAWYHVDRTVFYDNNSYTPDFIKNNPDQQSNHYSRQVLQQEVFPYKELQNDIVTNIQMLDLAYYPEERGPYNYDVEGVSGISAGMNNSGGLNNPETRWGGIMKGFGSTTDFEASNVEFIQFWLMDPFNEEDGDPNHSGGYLYFNLGEISEDILKDSHKMFENGLPVNPDSVSNLTSDDIDIWGRVTDGINIVRSFDNDPENRQYQDVGFDGLRDQEERVFYDNYVSRVAAIAGSNVAASVEQDPSADNFKYYNADADAGSELSIIERYKNYNGIDGNSPTNTSSNNNTEAGSNSPDTEDANRDDNLDDFEAYYQYRVRITPQDLQIENIGKNYISDAFSTTVTTKNGQTREIKWFQIKIPIRKPEQKFGNIQGFKSIRFMRMFLKGFEEPVVLRFASLDLVRGEWRRYEEEIIETGDYIPKDDDNTQFDISAVNIEENSGRSPINYVIPPNIQREIASGGSTIRQLNEQALVLEVCDLQDGATRATYKNLDLNIRQYETLKMFVHGESTVENEVKDGELKVFMRLGTDYENNYYEYEIPLVMSPWGSSNEFDVWPEDNNIELNLDELIDHKLERNNAGVSLLAPYTTELDGGRTITVVGNPALSEVKTIMIGVRNPRDDGVEKCAEVWVNELRLSNFKNRGGWAANAKVNSKVAEFGTVTLAGSMSTPGFGNIDQKLNERQQETKQNYDFSSSVAVDEFIPEAIRIKVPMYYSIGESWEKPRYNSLSPDVEVKLLKQNEAIDRDSLQSIRERIEIYSKRKSLNFTNVRLEPGPNKKRNHFYDVTNFSVSYAFTEVYSRDFNTEYAFEHNYKGGLTYNYTAKTKAIEPFKKIKFFNKNKSLKLIEEFNFYLLPKSYSFSSNLSRMYSERKRRDQSGFGLTLDPFVQKNFFWDRDYSLKYDLTKSLKFDYTGSNRAIIDEVLDKNVDDNEDSVVVNKESPYYDQWKQKVLESVKGFGTNYQYHHTMNLSYKLPIDKIPIFNWVNISGRYTANYDWQREPIGFNGRIGNTIQNEGKISGNARLNFTTLYNKWDYLKNLDKKKPKKPQPKPSKNPADTTNTKEEEDDEPSLARNIMDNGFRLLTSMESISANYATSNGTFLGGYGEGSNLMGFNAGFDAPGIQFISGIQEDDFWKKALYGGYNTYQGDSVTWLADSIGQLSRYFTSYDENISLKATFKPLQGMRIELSADRNYGENLIRNFFWGDVYNADSTYMGRGYNREDPNVAGNFSMSYSLWKTSFGTSTEELMQAFYEARPVISQLLAEKDTIDNNTVIGGYADGYSQNHQEVMINAFLSAYSGNDASSMRFGAFRELIPIPNWRVSYDGLGRIKKLKKIFESVTLNHAYRSSYTVNSFTSNLNFYDDQNNNSGEVGRNKVGDYFTQYQITTVTLVEQFSPLINIDMKWQNSLLTKFEIKRDRNIALGTFNGLITEAINKEYVVGGGYKFRNVKFPFKIGLNKKEIISDLDLRVDISIRDNITTLINIIEQTYTVQTGQNTLAIKISGDYKISRNLALRAYYDKVLNKPKTSNSFINGSVNAGVSLRFSLSQL